MATLAETAIFQAHIDRLARIVDESGLTRTEVAERAGITGPNLTRLLSGLRPNASFWLVVRVLRACDARLADLD